MFVGIGATVGLAVEGGLGTVLASGITVSASGCCLSEDWRNEHPVSSTAMSTDPAQINPNIELDTSALAVTGLRQSATGDLPT